MTVTIIVALLYHSCNTIFGPLGAPGCKAQHQKLNVICSFFIHKRAPDYKAH